MNSKKKYVIKRKHDDRYLIGKASFSLTSDISKATNYSIFRHIYKSLAEKKFEDEFVFINAIGITMNFDSKLEIETGGLKGFILKIALKFIRLLEKVQTRLNN